LGEPGLIVSMDMQVTTATVGDIARLHPVIERAYRGDDARVGWTHEADLVSGARTDVVTLTALVTDPASRLLIAWEGDTLLGCVNVADRGDGLAYLGLLCIEPARQGTGLGKRLMAAAETCAHADFAATRMEMTVIDRRVELIDWYRRHGYAPSGEARPFPIPLDPPLRMTVLVKPLV
jgi:GNAT superfamily N-acetyltransferase